MQKYTNSVTDLAGNVIVGASVTITILGTGAKATLFSDSAGTQSLANPLTTASDGSFSFCAANGHYNITITKLGLPSQVVVDVLLYDPADVIDNTTASRLAALEASMASMTTTVNGITSNINTVEDKVDVLYSSYGASSMYTNSGITVEKVIDQTLAANFTPSSNATPSAIGNMVFELTSDSTVKIKVQGSDGIIRTASITLS